MYLKRTPVAGEGQRGGLRNHGFRDWALFIWAHRERKPSKPQAKPLRASATPQGGTVIEVQALSSARVHAVWAYLVTMFDDESWARRGGAHVFERDQQAQSCSEQPASQPSEASDPEAEGCGWRGDGGMPRSAGHRRE
ncbi:hypothetical protein CDD83_8901 [Cordyceps sp. RAO-2017]|nr:hypothetical protein CDD83_8901 [Cordyceps sp. RAO-2017]